MGSIQRCSQSSGQSDRVAPLSPLPYVLAWEPQLHRLRDRAANSVQRGVPFAGCLRVMVSVYTDDITVFVSCRLDIKAVKKVFERYEEVAGAKINFDKQKSEVGCLEGWRCSPMILPLE